MFFLLLSMFSLADVPIVDLTEAVSANDEIVVEAYHDIQVYVAPIVVINKTEDTKVEAVIDEDAAFTYSGVFWRNAKVPKGVNSWQPVTMGDRDLMIYNSNVKRYLFWQTHAFYVYEFVFQLFHFWDLLQQCVLTYNYLF